MPEDWQERDPRIHGHTKPNPQGDGTEYRVMDSAQVDEKAGKKQEKGKMKEDGEKLNRPGKV